MPARQPNAIACPSARTTVSITDEFGTKTSNKVPIEIKDGTDKSNAHNRAGEAEKSHHQASGKDSRISGQAAVVTKGGAVGKPCGVSHYRSNQPQGP